MKNFSSQTSKSLAQLFLPPQNYRNDQEIPRIPENIVNQTKFSLRGGGNTKSQPEPSISPLQEVTCVATSEQSHYIICGFADGSIKIVDTHTAKTVFKIEKAHMTEICALAYSYDGRYVVSASLDGAIRVMDLHQHGKYYVCRNIYRNPEVLTISRNNKCIIGGFAGKVRVFGLKEGKCVRTMKSKSTENVSSLLISKNNRYIIANYNQPSNIGIEMEYPPIRLWSLYNEKFIKNFQCNLLGPWKACAFTKNEDALIFSTPHHIGFWSFMTGKVIREVKVPGLKDNISWNEPVIALHPTVDNKYFVCLYARNKMGIFDFVTIQRIIPFEIKASDEFYDMSLADNSKYIILKGILGSIKLYRFPQMNQNA